MKHSAAQLLWCLGGLSEACWKTNKLLVCFCARVWREGCCQPLMPRRCHCFPLYVYFNTTNYVFFFLLLLVQHKQCILYNYCYLKYFFSNTDGPWIQVCVIVIVREFCWAVRDTNSCPLCPVLGTGRGNEVTCCFASGWIIHVLAHSTRRQEAAVAGERSSSRRWWLVFFHIFRVLLLLLVGSCVGVRRKEKGRGTVIKEKLCCVIFFYIFLPQLNNNKRGCGSSGEVADYRANGADIKCSF